jgi:hypothetical protein
MPRYKLSTGLWNVTETPEFSTDKEAWEYLRAMLPNKYATLYKEHVVEVPHNNEDEYVPLWNSKYGPRPIGYGIKDSTKLKEIGMPATGTVWIPVLEGVTSHAYNVK